LLSGCQTTLDPNYAIQLESYRLTITSQQSVEIAKARAEEARFNAIAAIGERGDPQSRQLAILALAMNRGEGFVAQPVPVHLPNIPESQESRALKWAAIFAGPVMSITQGYFGYKLGVQQTRSTADTTIASYNALGTGFAATQGIAGAGFNAASGIAGAGFAATQGIAGAAFATNTRPNITLTNTNGVIGGGSYVGPNSGQNSGNTGRIGSPDDLRNCSVTDLATGGC
jgi:hypothetical protein